MLYNANPNGQYKTVSLKVTDNEGLSETIEKVVYLEAPIVGGPLY